MLNYYYYRRWYRTTTRTNRPSTAPACSNTVNLQLLCLQHHINFRLLRLQLTPRHGNKQAGLLDWLACLLTNQASQQAGRSILGKQASQNEAQLASQLARLIGNIYTRFWLRVKSYNTLLVVILTRIIVFPRQAFSRLSRDLYLRRSLY